MLLPIFNVENNMTTRHWLALLVLMLAAFSLVSMCAVVSREGAPLSTVLWLGGTGVGMALIAAVLAARGARR